MRKLGDNKPESQSLSLWVRETAQWARELSVSVSYKAESLEPRRRQWDKVLHPAGQASGSVAVRRSARHGAAPWCVETYCLGGVSEVHPSYTQILGTWLSWEIPCLGAKNSHHSLYQ